MTDSDKMDIIISELRSMKTEMQDMKSEIQNVKTEMQDMKSEIQNVKTEMQDMKVNLENVNEKVTKIDLTIENEIRVNIQRVAEGHLDLSRNMHEVMRPNNEIEMLAIKVRMLETDVREIKAKIS